MSGICESKYPISLSSFNKILDNSENNKSKLQDSYPFFIQLNRDEFTMELFIKKIECFIYSYSDLNYRKCNLCIKKIVQIFQNPSSEDLKALVNLKISVNKIFYNRFTKSANFLEYLKSIGKLSPIFNPVGFPLSISPLAEIKERVNQSNALTASERIKKIREVLVIDEESLSYKRILYSTIISILNDEAKFIHAISQFIESNHKNINLRAQYFSKADKTINFGWVALPLFEITPLEKEDVFEILLNVSSYIDIYTEENKIYVSISDSIFTLNNFNEKINNVLNKLLKVAVNEKLINFIKTTLFIQETPLEDPAVINEKLASYLDNYYAEDPACAPYIDLLCPTNKIGLFLKQVNKKVFPNKYDEQKFLDSAYDYIENCKELVNVWILNYENQKQLDIECRKLWAETFVGRTPSQKNIKSLTVKYLDIKSIINIDSKLFKLNIPDIEPRKRKLKQTRIAPKSKVVPAKKAILNPVNKSNQPIEEATKLEVKASIKENINPLTIQKKLGELPGSPFPYNFDWRVDRWHLHPFGMPFSSEVFEEYFEMSLARQRLMQIFHDPHPWVDRFLSLGIEGTWINTRNEASKRIVIPAEITFEGKRHRGFIAYGIDSTTCYHRYFKVQMDEDILFGTIKKIFNENDFPELQRASLSNQVKSKKLMPVHKEGSSWFQDSLTGNVTIEDSKRNVVIKLFNTK